MCSSPNIATTFRFTVSPRFTRAKASISPVRRWPIGSAARARFWTPLVAALRTHVFAGDRVHGDDTPVPVLEPGKGKTKTGRLWSYVRDGRPWAERAPPAVAYFYSPDRKGEHPQAHLKSFRGVLHADGYAGFRDLYEPKKAGEAASIVEAACLAHVRRKFFDFAASGPRLPPTRRCGASANSMRSKPRSAARRPSDDEKYASCKPRRASPICANGLRPC